MATKIALGEITYIPKGPITPSKFPDETFLLYSIPAYETGNPESLRGREIKSTKTEITEGDIIISKLNPRIPRVWLIKEKGNRRQICSTEFVPFRLKDKSQFDKEFLSWILLAPQFIGLLQKMVRSSTKSHERVRPADIAGLEVPIFSLDEQRRIVARIKECMERVEEIEGLRADSIEEAKATLPSLLNESFLDLLDDYDKVEIGEVAIETRYGTSRKCSTVKRGTAILRIPNVAGGFVNFDDLKYCPLDDKERNKLTLEKGDLLFVRTNGSRDLVGRCAIYEGNGNDQGYGFASYLIRVRLNQEKMRPHFLAFFLNSTHGRSELDKRRRTSAGQFNINSENLRNIEVPLPPVLIQDKIVESLKDHQTKVTLLQNQLQVAQEQESHIRESILRKAFAGEF